MVIHWIIKNENRNCNKYSADLGWCFNDFLITFLKMVASVYRDGCVRSRRNCLTCAFNIFHVTVWSSQAFFCIFISWVNGLINAAKYSILSLTLIRVIHYQQHNNNLELCSLRSLKTNSSMASMANRRKSKQPSMNGRMSDAWLMRYRKRFPRLHTCLQRDKRW